MRSSFSVRSLSATLSLVVLAGLLVQLGAPARSLAAVPSPNLVAQASVPGQTGKASANLLGNYDIRVLGSTELAALLRAYLPGGNKGIADIARANAGAMRTGLAQFAGRVPGAEATFSPLTGSAELVRSSQGALSAADPRRDGLAIVNDYLYGAKAVYGLSDVQVSALQFLGESVSPRSGLRMVRLEQQIDKLPIFQSETRFILDRDGRIIRSVGLLIPNGSIVPNVQPIAATDALHRALVSVGIDTPAAAFQVEKSNPLGTVTEWTSTDPRLTGPSNATLVYFPIAPGLLVPAWSTLTTTTGPGDWYTLIDAGTGTLLWRKNTRADADHATTATADHAPATQATLMHGQPASASVVGTDAGSSLQPSVSAVSTQQARFSVYVQADGVTPADSPAPQSPSTAAPGAGTQYPEITRTIVNMLTAQDITASPDGWITDGITTTIGNNVDAYVDRLAPNGPDTGTIDNNGRPFGNPDANALSRDFLGTTPRNYTYTPAPSGSDPEAGDTPTGVTATQVNFRRGAVTQLFYISNWYHDQLYNLGFNEAAANFQNTNFSGMGAGGDRVLAEVQDSSGTNNANFNTQPDGTPGRMQMFRFTGPNIDRDASLDAEIVIHELTHGLSNRIIGNADGLIWSPGQGMGEGWSDFYALSLLNNTNADDPNGQYASGAYSLYKFFGLAFTDNYVYGIRRFPFSTNNTVNPLTWADVDDTTFNASGGIPISPLGFELGGGLEVHNSGELWTLSLWEVRSRIIADPAGANGDVPTGNQTMLQLVTDAMKLTPLNPSFIEARDALIDADCATNACANERWIWEGFADRGLGYPARAPLKQVGYANVGHMGVAESFNLPNLDVQTVTINDSQGNNNAAIDPGEPIYLNVTLLNPWQNAAQGVISATATLSSTTPGVTIRDNTATYGAIPAAGSATGDSFLVFLGTGATCGQSLSFTITITSTLGTTTIPYTPRIGTASGTGTPVTYTRTIAGGLTIQDNRPQGAVDSLTITDDFAIADLNFRVDDLRHTFPGDVTALLRAPNGYGTDLIAYTGGGVAGGGNGDNFINTVIDGQSTNDLLLAQNSQAPYTGSWAPVYNAGFWSMVEPGSFPDPVDQLSRVNGLSTQGVWKILVADNFQFDSGTLNAWSLIVTPVNYTCTPFAPTALVAGTKTVVGNYVPGGSITYTVTLTNTGSADQADNAGDEFTDVLPSNLTLVSATATSGNAVATVGTNTVTWNGTLLALGGSTTITINATINPNTGGAAISNQGNISFDADGNGINESSAVTDDPSTAAANDPTVFNVVANTATATATATATSTSTNTATSTPTNTATSTATGTATTTSTATASPTGTATNTTTATASPTGTATNTTTATTTRTATASPTGTAASTTTATPTNAATATTTRTATASPTGPAVATSTATSPPTTAGPSTTATSPAATASTTGTPSTTTGTPTTPTATSPVSNPSRVYLPIVRLEPPLPSCPFPPLCQLIPSP